jgi:hypothetical protein
MHELLIRQSKTQWKCPMRHFVFCSLDYDVIIFFLGCIGNIQWHWGHSWTKRGWTALWGDIFSWLQRLCSLGIFMGNSTQPLKTSVSDHETSHLQPTSVRILLVPMWLCEKVCPFTCWRLIVSSQIQCIMHLGTLVHQWKLTAIIYLKNCWVWRKMTDKSSQINMVSDEMQPKL